jgi:hypothetical protein
MKRRALYWSRERAVELSRIEKEKALEIERKNIQDVIRERVVVERGVVEEQERIKSVQVLEDARRNRDAVIIAAEAEAQEKLVKDIKAAEAAAQAAVHIARERVMLADADLEAADREAKAKIRLAEGQQAQAAASGLADVKVKGDLTLGENTADLGGLKLAFMAMTEATKSDPEPAKYRFNSAQQFFLGYAQSWCSKYREEHARLRAATDPHSPPSKRLPNAPRQGGARSKCKRAPGANPGSPFLGVRVERELEDEGRAAAWPVAFRAERAAHLTGGIGAATEAEAVPPGPRGEALGKNAREILRGNPNPIIADSEGDAVPAIP